MSKLAAMLVPAVVAAQSVGQEIWAGYEFEFVKPDGADWTLPEFQDRLTDDVWLTRKDVQGLFNISTEPGYTDFFSPEDTEWAFGTTDEIDTLSFDCWECITGSAPPAMVGRNAVVHLISDDVYVDIRFTSWSCCGAGGFSYLRGAPAACRADVDANGSLNVFDFLAYVNLFVTGDPLADFDGDGELTLFDFMAFRDEFDVGCE